MTGMIKRAARHFGASMIGIAKLDMRWVYSHHYFPETGASEAVEIDAGFEFVIMAAMEEDYDTIRTAPSALYHCGQYVPLAAIVRPLNQPQS
jgi:hypothetical protein